MICMRSKYSRMPYTAYYVKEIQSDLPAHHFGSDFSRYDLLTWFVGECKNKSGKIDANTKSTIG